MANITPIFPATPRVGVATLISPTPVTSRADITGTTGLVSLITGVANATRIDRITVKAKETTVAGSVCIWYYNGTTSYLIKEIIVSAITASNTVASFEFDVTFNNLILPSASTGLYVSSTIDQDFAVFAFGGDY